MIEFILLLLSLLFIFGAISLILKDMNISKVGKNFFAILLTYLTPSIFVLVAGFSSLLMKESLLCLSFLLFVSVCLNKKSIPRFECFALKESVNTLLISTVLIVLYFLLKSSLGTVWISLDDSTYHAAIPMLWIKFNSFYVPELTYQGPFPLGGSLFSTFFMTFVKTEYLSSVSEITLLLLAITLVRYFSEYKKIVHTHSLVLVLAYFTSADVIKYLKGFSDSDISSGILMSCLFVLLITKKEKHFYYVLIGLLLGFLLSIKLTNLIFLLPFSWFAFQKLKKSKYIYLLSLFLTSAVVCLPWYVRNIFFYKNPFAPFEKYGFSGAMSKELIKETSLLGIWDLIDTGKKLLVMKGFFGWQPFSWLLSVLILIFLIITLFGKKSQKNGLSIYLIGSLFLFFGLFIGAPFSGLNESLEVNENSSRYLLSWYFVALFFSWISIVGKNTFSSKTLIGFTMLILTPFFINNAYDKALYPAILFSLLLFIAKKFKVLNNLKFNLILPLITVVFVAFFYGGSKTKNSKESTIWYLKELNKIKGEKRVSMFDGFIFRGFFLSGEKFQHIPIRQNFDGGNADLRNPINASRKYFFRGEDFLKTNVFCEKFLKNSKKLNIEVFIFGKDGSGVLPKQYCESLLVDYEIFFKSKSGIILVKKNSTLDV